MVRTMTTELILPFSVISVVEDILQRHGGRLSDLNLPQGRLKKLVAEALSDVDIIPDRAALSVYQYFENVRNFLVAVEEMGLPMPLLKLLIWKREGDLQG
ncbi:unnamed protein product [Lupinus luteus]|uniref:Uncharacterized protein n=1 Tax=Lupinus luteus TaxID=3873 RepID=A0AAV1X5T9_LUPLU